MRSKRLSGIVCMCFCNTFFTESWRNCCTCSHTVNPKSESAKLRYAAEKGWLNLIDELDLSAFIFRLGGIYGPGRRFQSSNTSTRFTILISNQIIKWIQKCKIWQLTFWLLPPCETFWKTKGLQHFIMINFYFLKEMTKQCNGWKTGKFTHWRSPLIFVFWKHQYGKSSAIPIAMIIVDCCSALDTIAKSKSLSQGQKLRQSKQYTARIHVADIDQAILASMSIRCARFLFSCLHNYFSSLQLLQPSSIFPNSISNCVTLQLHSSKARLHHQEIFLRDPLKFEIPLEADNWFPITFPGKYTMWWMMTLLQEPRFSHLLGVW